MQESRVYAWLQQLVPELKVQVKPHHRHGNFGGPAVRTVGCLLAEHLKALDPSLEPSADLHVEGQPPPPWMDEKRTFLGSRCYPDLWLRFGDKRVAIEVDHGWTGAQVRNALTKGSFNVAVGDWHECIVLFFDETGGELMRAAEGEREARILSDYRERHKTYVVFIPFHKEQT